METKHTFFLSKSNELNSHAVSPRNPVNFKGILTYNLTETSISSPGTLVDWLSPHPHPGGAEPQHLEVESISLG